MKKIYILSLVPLLCSLSLKAQNINQSVEVTNTYESSFADMPKQNLALSVPDSLYRFDYDFKYTIFDPEYKGSYDFSPYRIDVRPGKMPFDGSKFYLKAGAGYRLYPVLDLMYDAVSKPGAALSLYNFTRGYYGKSALRREEPFDLTSYDFTQNTGLAGRWMFKGNTLDYHAAYQGLYAASGGLQPADPQIFSGSVLHSATVGASIRPEGRDGTFFYYDLDLDYRFNSDMLISAGNTRLQEHCLGVKATVRPVLNRKFRMLIDGEFALDAVGGQTSMLAGITPRFLFNFGALALNVGAMFDYSLTPDGGCLSAAPALEARLRLFHGRLDIFAEATGGQKLNSLHDLKSFNHFFRRDDMFSTVNTRVRYDASVGLRGSAISQFEYGLKAGYRKVDSALMNAFLTTDFGDIQQAYADVFLVWKSERVEFDGNFHWCNTQATNVSLNAFLPSAFSGGFRFTYNHLRRIFASLAVEGASKMKQADHNGPSRGGYVDLSLEGEWRFSRNAGLWVKAGNLTGMAIEKVPGHVVKGPYFTGGITLKF